MYPVDLPHYKKRFQQWKRADPSQRVGPVSGRDGLRRKTIDYYSYGVLRCRVVLLGDGYVELMADRGMRFADPDFGKISFSHWMDPDESRGTAKRIPPMRAPPSDVQD